MVTGAVAFTVMKPFFRALFGACLLFASTHPALAFQRFASVTVTHLTGEYLTDPLGLDAPQARLGWQLDAVNATARGQRQTAYRILVASSPERLQQDQGDLWDSGRVASRQSQLITYGGSPLRAGI